jgi:mannose-1-phosphate guanylyltransferase/mannose-6-phosphate isomerase
MNLQPVILSGGSGTRLWPLSREKHPKQLLALNGRESMLQATARRVSDIGGSFAVASRLIILCNEEYRFITAEQLRDIDLNNQKILLEPVGRNTAPALTLAAMAAMKEQDDTILLVMPADHVIANKEAFQAAVKAGLTQAEKGAIITFGIKAHRPETGYGYIKMGNALTENDIYTIDAFVEKPDLLTAQTYLSSGQYLWNSGIFMMRASVWLRAITHFNPAMSMVCQQSITNAKSDCDFVRISKEDFSECPSDSIDYAVMEKLNHTPALGIQACVIPLDVGWSDVGAWDAVWEVSEKDTNGNSTRGDVMLENSENCLAIADSRLLVCLGMEDAIIIETPDAVLVTNKANTSGMKQVIARLKEGKYQQTDNHRKVYRPWGHYDSVDSGEHFQVKRIVVKPGGRLSLQLHNHRAEHWVIVSGVATVTRGEEVMTLHPNESTFIPLGVQHRLENLGEVDLEVIEVQSGSYLGEDDIVRFGDIYGRTDA